MEKNGNTYANKLNFMREVYTIINTNIPSDEYLIDQFSGWWVNTRKSGGYMLVLPMQRMLSTYFDFIEIPIRGSDKYSTNQLLSLMDKSLGCPYQVNKQVTIAQLLLSDISSMIVLCGSVSEYLELAPEREWATHTYRKKINV